MASYSVGNATWTNGSHSVLCDASTGSPFPVLFLSNTDTQVGGPGSPYLAALSSTGSVTNTINDVIYPYSSKGGWARETQVNTAGSCSIIRFNGGNNDAFYGNNLVSGNATHITLMIRTVGNIGGWQLIVRSQSGNNTGASMVLLPATPDNVWTPLTLTIPAFNGEFVELAFRSNLGNSYFLVGDRISVTTAYIHGDTIPNVPEPEGTISPDGGATLYNVDTIQHIYTATGPRYLFYVSTPYAATTGSFATTYTDPVVGVNRDFSGNIAGTGVLSSLISLVKSFTSTISAASGVSSEVRVPGVISVSGNVDGVSDVVGTSSVIRKMVSAVFGSSGVSSSLTTNALLGSSLGPAVWTNGSKVVTFVNPNPHIVMLDDYYPYYYSGATNFTGPSYPVALAMAGEWGTGDYDNLGQPIDPHAGQINYVRDAVYTQRTDAVSYASPVAAYDYQLTDNASACRITRPGINSFGDATGLQKLVVVANFISHDGNYTVPFSVCASGSVTGGVDTSNGVTIGTPVWGTWNGYVVDIPNSLSEFKQLSLYHTNTDTVYRQSAIIDTVYLTDNSEYAILPGDNITIGGSGPIRRFTKITQNGAGAITGYLSSPYTGVSGTYDTFRSPADNTPWTASISAVSSVDGGDIFPIKYLSSAISAASSIASNIGKLKGFIASIAATSSGNANTFGNVISFVGDIVSSSTASATQVISKAFNAVVSGSGEVSAVDYIRFKMYDAVVQVSTAVSGVVGKLPDFTGSISASSFVDAQSTRIIFLASSAISAAHSVVVGTIGYATQLEGAVVSAVSNVVGSVTDVVRGFGGAISGTSGVTSTISLDVTFRSVVNGLTGMEAAPSFTIGMMPVNISGHSSVLADEVIRAAVLSAVVNAGGNVVVGDFLPAQLLTATISASGSVSASLVKELSFGGNIVSVADINTQLNALREFGSYTEAGSRIISWLDVPEAIRQLLVTSSGIIIGADVDGNVSFTDVTNTQAITVRGISVVQLNDARTNQHSTIIVVV